MPRILIADDKPDIREALRLLLKSEGYETEAASSPRAVLTGVEAKDFDAVLIDLNYARDTTSGQEGLDLLSRLQALDSTLPVVVMTAWGSIELAVEAMRRGARDFIQKPWDNARLLATVRTQVELARALRWGKRLEAENVLLRGEGQHTLIAESPAMRPVRELIASVGPSDANVFITGENGTGKTVVAQALHAVSARAPKAMISVNVAGISEGLFESEFFGHVKGAFTDAKMDRVGRFELADGGTIFLDEIASIPLTLQAKLLRVIESGEFERVGSSKTTRVNVRIISATNADIHSEVSAGRFRQDLLFRLNTVDVRIPPLRDRREDVPRLASYFQQIHARRYRRSAVGFDPAAMQALLDYPWPGNVRELDHTVERAVLLAEGSQVRLSDLGLRAKGEDSKPLDEMNLEELELFLIQKTLARNSGNVSHAARALGLSRSAFYRRMQKYGL